ncbi:MAG: hypothetical protein AAB691_05190 [Patescibacteria group bacterium]
MKRKSDFTFWIVIVVVLAAIIGWAVYSNNAPGQYDQFAQCLKDNGAKFYGAFWCPHCQNQKAMFGNSARLLPYVECSTPNREQLAICNNAKVQSYPTWRFADGTELTGEIPLSQLAEKTSCVLPK